MKGLNKEIKEWNKRYPVGTNVFVQVGFHTIKTKTSSEAVRLSEYEAGVYVEHVPGVFSLDYVKPCKTHPILKPFQLISLEKHRRNTRV